MPNEEVVATETPTDGTGATTTDGSGNQQATPQTDGQLFFGKYNSREEAEKAWQERESLMGRHADELGRLRQETETLRAQAEIKDALATLINSQKREDAEPIPFEKFEETLAEAARTDPGDGLKKALRATHSWLADAEKKTKTYADEKLSSVQEELKAMRLMVEKLDPDYQANKDIIEKLVSDGMPIGKAKEWAKRMKVAAEPSQTMTPPGSISGQRVIPKEPAKGNPYLLTAEDREVFKSQGMTDEMLNQMDADRKTRYEAQERKRQKGGNQ